MIKLTIELSDKGLDYVYEVGDSKETGHTPVSVDSFMAFADLFQRFHWYKMEDIRKESRKVKEAGV